MTPADARRGPPSRRRDARGIGHRARNADRAPRPRAARARHRARVRSGRRVPADVGSGHGTARRCGTTRPRSEDGAGCRRVPRRDGPAPWTRPSRGPPPGSPSEPTVVKKRSGGGELPRAMTFDPRRSRGSREADRGQRTAHRRSRRTPAANPTRREAAPTGPRHGTEAGTRPARTAGGSIRCARTRSGGRGCVTGGRPWPSLFSSARRRSPPPARAAVPPADARSRRRVRRLPSSARVGRQSDRGRRPCAASASFAMRSSLARCWRNARRPAAVSRYVVRGFRWTNRLSTATSRARAPQTLRARRVRRSTQPRAIAAASSHGGGSWRSQSSQIVEQRSTRARSIDRPVVLS